jgi:hypothetical protein
MQIIFACYLYNNNNNIGASLPREWLGPRNEEHLPRGLAQKVPLLNPRVSRPLVDLLLHLGLDKMDGWVDEWDGMGWVGGWMSGMGWDGWVGGLVTEI